MLDKRLMAIASLVRRGSYLCDIGTDHAYLPCYLAKEGITSHCVACDINEQPLKSATERIVRMGLQAEIETLLSDGLADVPSHMAQDIVIAGMGGELIANILLATPFTRDSNRQFLLQPMTQAPYLRKTLYENGFMILQETPVIDKHHYYTIIQAVYCNIKTTCSEVFSILGKIPEHKSPAALNYCTHEYNKIMSRIQGIKCAKESLEITHLLQLADEINEVILNVQTNQK